MPIFYFDLSDGCDITSDDDGTRFADRKAARAEAMGILSDMGRSELPDGDDRTLTVTVRDEARTPIYSAQLVVSGRWLDG